MPSALLKYCNSDLPATDGTQDQTTLSLFRMYQLYGICAGDMATLVDFLQGEKITTAEDEKALKNIVETVRNPDQSVEWIGGKPFVLQP